MKPIDPISGGGEILRRGFSREATAWRATGAADHRSESGGYHGGGSLKGRGTVGMDTLGRARRCPKAKPLEFGQRLQVPFDRMNGPEKVAGTLVLARFPLLR
jgi:hypothetical protein